MGWWSVLCCPNDSIMEWWNGWVGLSPSLESARVWGTLFFAIVWMTWETRNQLVFEGKSLSVGQAEDNVKFKVTWWFKYHDKGSKDTITALLLNIKKLFIDAKIGKQSKNESNTAEIRAIQKACALCVGNSSLSGRNIEVVSDSKVAVFWINNGGYGSIKHVNTIYDIWCNLDILGGTKVSYNSRASNHFADELAKRGSSSAGDFVRWGEI
ncbi:hypothetical protein Dsin_017332 [Dipteronia sinensis]|uniref:RNase H type-1 domain-containing protein n=1 Tax=Dipteronia sinensis TaxID=43782 RepID=A0AAE0AFC4_9ROSI|nr:hypothetical protein Dsin_017332 [Dipteronia sinensis]